MVRTSNVDEDNAKRYRKATLLSKCEYNVTTTSRAGAIVLLVPITMLQGLHSGIPPVVGLSVSAFDALIEQGGTTLSASRKLYLSHALSLGDHSCIQ
jgi:hypothetical protein